MTSKSHSGGIGEGRIKITERMSRPKDPIKKLANCRVKITKREKERYQRKRELAGGGRWWINLFKRLLSRLIYPLPNKPSQAFRMRILNLRKTTP